MLYIPRPAESPEVIANVDDINNNVGFWRSQPSLSIPLRESPGLEEFPDIELEAAFEDLVETFVDYQTDVLLRSIEQNPDADLVLGYIEEPDGSEHQFLLTDLRQPTDISNPYSIGAGQDPAKVERYADYVLNAYQTVSDSVQRVIDAVGVDENGVPNSNIIITSDHGFAPLHTAVSINNILANAGFDPNEVRAVTSGPVVNFYINLEGREPNGVVDPSEYKELQQRILATLGSLQDTNPNYALEGAVPIFDRVFERSVPDNPTAEDIITATSEFIGQDTGDIFAVLKPGYQFDAFQEDVPRLGDTAPSEGQEPIFSVTTVTATHGYDPNYPELQAIFLAAGPDFNPEALSELEEVRSIDIAPTILDLLDVEPAPTVEGESIFARNAGDDLNCVFGNIEDDTAQIPGSVDTFTDFGSSEDVLGFAGLGIDFGQFSSSQDGDNSLITANDDNLAVLSGEANSLSASSFGW